MPKIKNMGTATMRFAEGVIISGSTGEPAGSYSDFALVVTGSSVFDTRDGASGDSGGITLIKDEQDPVFIRFINDDDPTSWYAFIAMDSAENFYISPGRSQDFYIITRENSGANYYYPFRIFDNGKIKFHQAAQSSSDAQTELPADVVFSVSGSKSGTDGISVFGGNVLVSGSFMADENIWVGAENPNAKLSASGSLSGNYIAQILNGEGSSGHGLKIQSYGNGSSTYLLDVTGRDDKTVLRADADGHVGIGNHGNSLPAALSVKQYASAPIVNVKDSSGNAVFKIDGDAKVMIADNLYHSGDLDTYIGFPGTNEVNLVAGGHSFLKCDGDILINNANENRDTKIMADDGNVVLHVDAGTNKVGIGTTSPAQLLTLNATEPTILFEENGTDRATIGINNSDNIVIENKTLNKHIVFKCNDQGVVREGLRLDGAVPEVVVNQQSESLINFRVESDNNTHMLFVTGSDKVGVGTSSPISELDVSGSIAITKAISTPSQPAVDQGYLYTKSDGKLYWRSSALAETDLTAAGGSGDNLSLTALKTGNYTAANWEMVLVNLVGASGDVTITLPAASSNKQVAVKIAGLAMGKEVIVDGNSSETIDGLTTRIMNTDYESMHLISDGSNWWRIS